ncbi:MAG: hypothetical protein RL497_2754 [Pseudomonadota bacterium]
MGGAVGAAAGGVDVVEQFVAQAAGLNRLHNFWYVALPAAVGFAAVPKTCGVTVATGLNGREVVGGAAGGRAAG